MTMLKKILFLLVCCQSFQALSAQELLRIIITREIINT